METRASTLLVMVIRGVSVVVLLANFYRRSAGLAHKFVSYVETKIANITVYMHYYQLSSIPLVQRSV